MNVLVNISGPLFENSLFSPDRWTAIVILKTPGTWDGNLHNLGMTVQAMLDKALSNLDLLWVGAWWMTSRSSFRPKSFHDAFQPTLDMRKFWESLYSHQRYGAWVSLLPRGGQDGEQRDQNYQSLDLRMGSLILEEVSDSIKPFELEKALMAHLCWSPTSFHDT